MKLLFRKIKGYTLNELLVVLIIVGVLILLALPSLLPLITRAKSTEAQMQLGHLQMLEKNHFYMYSCYSDDLNKLGFEQVKTVDQGGKANYVIQVVSADKAGFIGRATAIVDFDGDGVFNVWEIDQENNLKEVLQD